MTAPGEARSVDFEVVLVVYKSRRHVEHLLASWGTQVPVAVVDNSGNADGVADVVTAHGNSRFLDGGGQGFARAANLGAFTSRHPFVVFVNPDTRPTFEQLCRLVEELAQDPVAASHAATVTDADGRVEIGVGGWEPTVRRAVVHALGLHKKWPDAGVWAHTAGGGGRDVEWTTGACMAVPTEVFRTLGGFDEMFYVYAEDMSFGRRARLCGYRQVLRPDIRVPHGAGSSGAPSAEMMRLRGASFAYYMTSYHRSARAAGVLAATVVGYAARAVVAAFRRRGELARRHLMVVLGLVSRRATVGGVEVARRRYLEVTAPSPADEGARSTSSGSSWRLRPLSAPRPGARTRRRSPADAPRVRGERTGATG